jgi:DNA repair protein SbcC/Rad50
VQARDAASRAAAVLPAAQARADTARRAASDAAALIAEHARRGELREAHLAARETYLAAKDAALVVRAARIDGMRAELAAEMTDGSPCPVCGSLDHPDPVDAASFPPLSRADEEAAFRLASEAAQAADQAGQQVARAEALLGDLARRLSSAGRTVPATGSLDTGALDTGALDTGALDTGALAAIAGAARADADLLEAEAARLAETAACLTDLQGELDDLDADIAAGQRELAELAEQRTAALDEARAADARAAARRAELAAELAGGDLEYAIGAANRLAEALLTAASLADQLAAPDLAVPLDPPAPVA